MGVHIVAPTTGMTRLLCDRSPRVALVTDAASADSIPLALREVSDTVILGDLSSVGRRAVPKDADGVLVWCKGEQPMSGTAADWRRAFFVQPPCNTWVAVHWPCLDHADLLGIEPRIQIAGSRRSVHNPWIRLAGSTPSAKMKTAWRENGEPWARLSQALWQELERPGASIDSLRDLWQTGKVEPTLSALVLRNLIVVLMRRGDWSKAEELLELGKKAFPGYCELSYLHAVSCLLQNQVSKAIKFLESSMVPADRELVGSGGENSYRARFLLGSICDMVGQQEKAMNYWMPCINERPAFRPAIQALLQQQIPRAKAAWMHQPLGEMVRREPQFLEPVLNFMLAHRMLAPARRLVETMDLLLQQQERYLDALAQAEARIAPRPRRSGEKPGILLSGPLIDASGHARTNRAIGLALLHSSQFDASLDSTSWPTLSLRVMPQGEKIWWAVQRQLARLDLSIRHQWPPVFERPTSGKLVCILPWEHKAVPLRWVEEIESKVDELWTPSEFVRRAFLSGGVSPERVRMLPNGVDAKTFTPEGPVTKLAGSRGFVFLFVGGPIRRKGIDVLLQAFGDAFTPEDDVTLVVKDLGSNSFYRGITRLADVQNFACRPTAPHTLIVSEELDDAALAALYRGADALVLPYRGEGFGMPMVEAMACGTPIIATGEGPAAEFCAPEHGYLLPAREVDVPEPPPPLGEFAGQWTWFEPDVTVLAHTMRHVYEHREEAADRGRKASEAIRRTFTWERVLPMYLQRMAQLTGAEPVEMSSALVPPGD